MNAGEVVGGVALIGILALVGLAVTADDDPQTLTGATTPGLPTDASSTSADTSTAVSADTTGSADTSDLATTEPATTEPVTTERVTTTTAPAPLRTVPPLSRQERVDVVVRVLNGGAEDGAAAFVSGVLRTAGFEPIQALDAAQPIDTTTVFHTPGLQREAADVNSLIEADPRQIVEGTDDDANWRQFGQFVDVLVILGPSPTGAG